jgi:hypothetical protein
MAIEDRSLKAGTKLVARYKGKDYTCQVVDTKEGRRYIVDDGADFQAADFKSPSSAGSAVMGGSACNGWRFWSIEGQEPTPKRARKANPDGAAKGFRQLDDGRYYCEACAEPFTAPKDVTPQGCPKGHSPDGDTAKTAKGAATA